MTDRGGTSNDSTAFQLGALTSSVATLQTAVAEMGASNDRLWEANDQNNVTLARIDQRLKDNSTTALVKKVKAEAVTETIVKEPKPWDKPVGEILFNILIKGLMVVGVGVVLAFVSKVTGMAF